MDEHGQNSGYREEWQLELLKLLHGRYSILDEVLRLTDEIANNLSRNDRISVQMLLEMRAKELEHIDENMRRFQIFKEQFPDEIQREMENLLQTENAEAEGPYAVKIAESVKNCEKLLKQIIEIDKRMSKRVAGSDSFYEK